jgi:glyoxylase-like metal-dependent hydrolase (beta-lactamase superfamily II)
MKLGVITDGISRDFAHALEVMDEFGLDHAELQFLWAKEVGDLDAGERKRALELIKRHGKTVSCEGNARLVQANVVPLADRMAFLKDEDEVIAGISGLAAQGHTPGHMAFHIESDGRRLLLWGDTANHFVVSVQRPDWHVQFDMDKAEAAATRKRIFDLAATDRIPVTGYHMPFPAVGFIDRQGSDYRWVPAGFQTSL